MPISRELPGQSARELTEAQEQEVRRAARMVAAAFREVGWKWGGNFDGEGHVPDAFEVADVIRHLVHQALELEPGRSCGTGGIDAYCHEDDPKTVSVELALTTMWSEDNDG